MIIIVGVGRSGTSLLQSMLNAHSEIGVLPEIKYFRRFLFSKSLERFRKKNGTRALIQFLGNDSLLSRLNVDFSKFIEWENLADRSLDLKIFDCIAEEYLGKEGKTILGYKDPRCIENLRQIKAWFPNAYVIHIIRDPRDILLSKTKADWSKSRSWFLHILINQLQLQLGLNSGYLFKERYIEIHYEALLREPEQSLRSLCEKLGVIYEDSMLEFSHSATKLVSPDEMQWKKETLGPLLQDNIRKWEGELSCLQIGSVEELVGSAFEHYNYQKTCSTLTPWQTVVFPVIRTMNDMAAAAYDFLNKVRI
ncbi:MAG: hypothetical protein NPIRA02_42060 [Nitrospirales bacterium]|nr:MAG: hypothetical protein NPIRA02_42060 [Nitrospirales bacterium]